MVAVDLVWGTREHITVGGVDVHVEVAGPPDAPVVGLLHGFSSGTFTWAGVAPLLADRFRLVAWDRPPFGRSGRPSAVRGDDPYTGAVAVEQGLAVLRSHTSGDQPVSLVGHSAGAGVAADLASDPRAHVGALVLVAPALDSGPPALVRRAFGLPGAGRVSAGGLRVALLGAAPVIRAVGRHRTPLLDATAAESARLLRRPGTATALVHMTRTWRPPGLLAGERVPACPSLVISGDEDRISPPSSTVRLSDAIGADHHHLAGVGHAPHEQRPDVVARLIGAFLEDRAR